MAEPSKTNKERLKEITDGIEAGIKELFQSDRFADYLRTMGRFHKYSLNNTILIHLQRPDATLVAGFNKWRDQFGRNVKRGEKGIKIIAPTPFKKKIEEAKLDPDTKLPMRDKDGKIIMEETEISIPMFIVHAVFRAHDLHGAFADVALGNPFQPPALVLDVLHLQIKEPGQLAGERIAALLVAVFHLLDGLMVGHICATARPCALPTASTRSLSTAPYTKSCPTFVATRKMLSWPSMHTKSSCPLTPALNAKRLSMLSRDAELEAEIDEIVMEKLKV